MDQQLRNPSVRPLAGTDADALIAGRYEIEGPLGRGGMGEVLLAFDLGLRRQVAMKAPHGSGPLDEADLIRFRREARAAAVLSHPNIVAVYDIVVDRGRPYIVMELIPGSSLASVLAAGRPLQTERAVGIAAAVAGALAFAHAVGVVHRDIKPSNIMLTSTGRVKVLDFGIARFATATPTESRTPIGTPEYLSPEQVTGGDVDARSDLYSLGAVLYEMLTGRPPFTGEPVSVVYQHLERRPAPPSAHRPGLDPALEALVLRCLAKDPSSRPSSAAALEADLIRISAGSQAVANGLEAAANGDETVDLGPPAASGPSTAVLPSPTGVLPRAERPAEHRAKRPRRSRRRRAWLLSVAALLIVALVVSGLVVHPWRTAPVKAAPHPKPQPPTLFAPVGVSAKGACDGFFRYRVTVSWTASPSPQVDGYEVFRSTAGGAAQRVGRVPGRPATAFVDHDLGSSTAYRYTVRATSGLRSSPASAATATRTPFFCVS